MKLIPVTGIKSKYRVSVQVECRKAGELEFILSIRVRVPPCADYKKDTEVPGSAQTNPYLLHSQLAQIRNFYAGPTLASEVSFIA